MGQVDDLRLEMKHVFKEVFIPGTIHFVRIKILTAWAMEHSFIRWKVISLSNGSSYLWHKGPYKLMVCHRNNRSLSRLAGQP